MDVYDVEEKCKLYHFIMKLMSFQRVGTSKYTHKHAHKRKSKSKMLSLIEFVTHCISSAFKSRKHQATGLSFLLCRYIPETEMPPLSSP